MSPANGTKTTDTTPALSWDSVTGASKYEVQLADTKAGMLRAQLVVSSIPSYTPETVLPNGRVYYWRVRAVDAEGIPTIWSQSSILEVRWGTMGGINPLRWHNGRRYHPPS